MPKSKTEELLKKLKPQPEHDREKAPAELPAGTPTPEMRGSVIRPRAFLALIEMMRECGRYEWADETLTGIYDTVRERDFVTEGQRRAVVNIRERWRDWYDELPTIEEEAD